MATDTTAPTRRLGLLAWAAAALLLAFSSCLIYLPGVTGGFIFDDRPAILENTRLHIRALDIESLAQAAVSFEPGRGSFQARPLSMVSFGINHAVHGLDPQGYKLTGILVHAVNALLILALAYRLIGIARPGRDARWAALAVAAAWALHPLQVSTVLYVVQRMEALSLLFVLASLLCYLHARLRQLDGTQGWPWLVACVPLLGLALAAKETAVLFPVYALAMELTVLRFAAADPRTRRRWVLAYLLGCAIAAVTFFAFVVPHYWTPADPVVRGFGTADRLLTQLRVLPMYLGQMLLPLPSAMPFYYDQIVPSRGWLQPGTTLVGGVLLLSLAASAVVLRTRLPLYSLGIALFFAAHALTSNVVPLEIAFEHRNYFALFGIVLAIGALVMAIRLPRMSAHRWMPLAAVIVFLAFLTFIRSSTWGDPLLLATEHVAINPVSSRASVDLAAEYLEMTDGYPNSPFNDFAMREFERGALIPGASVVSDQGLILSAAKAGRPVEPEWWDRLQNKLEYGTISPDTTQAMFGLLRNRMNGVNLDDGRLTDALLVMLNRAQFPSYTYAQVGDYVLVRTGDHALADQLFVRAIEAGASSPDYARQLVLQLQRDGHTRQARAALSRAQQLGVLTGETIEVDLPRP